MSNLEDLLGKGTPGELSRHISVHAESSREVGAKRR